MLSLTLLTLLIVAAAVSICSLAVTPAGVCPSVHRHMSGIPITSATGGTLGGPPRLPSRRSPTTGLFFEKLAGA